ncbi:hypothetical protein BJ742DRAFT_773876 [Cladochytrium replicatum]|nr:hypothetical protein BJ742DRAFT_773876 [Cladochytrium replicatum]
MGVIKGTFRCICCTVCIVVLLIGAGVAAFILWARAPTVDISNLRLDSSKTFTGLTLSATSFNAFLLVTVKVYNPNFVTAKFDSIGVQMYNPTYNTGLTPFAEGLLNTGSKIVFNAHDTTTLDFPITMSYSATTDKNKAFLTYLLTQCATKQNLDAVIKVNGSFTVIAWSVSPSYTTSASYPCPFGNVGL